MGNSSELKSLLKLFQNRLFRIPDYQRGYAWQQPQLVDFWDDLVNLHDDRYHYTGMISLKRLSKKELDAWGNDRWMVDKGYEPCHIVDGQQRLTTFVILLNEIVCLVRELDHNKGLSDKQIVIEDETLEEIVRRYIAQSRPPQNIITTYLFGYEADNPSADYLRYRIFNEPYTGSVSETYYTKNLKFAKQFFAENLHAYYAEYGIKGINELYHKLTNQLVFNIHEIDDDYDVFVAFETMNNRGKKLTNLELLKNRLIYLTTIYEDAYLDAYNKDELRKTINSAWKEVYYQLGRNKSAPLSDDEFLRAHWILYYSYSRRRGDDYIRFLLRKFSAKNVFTKKTVVHEESAEAEDHGEPAVLDDEEAAYEPAETELQTVAQLEPREIRDYVLSLKETAKHWYDSFFPYESDVLTDEEKLWIDRLNRIGIGYFRPLVMAALSAKASPADRVSLFQAIERFLFICFRLGNYQATYRSSEYYRATRSLYLGETDLPSVTKDIDETVQRNIEYTIPNFVTRMENRFSSGDGFYGWGSLRYFLFEYEYSLAEKLNAAKKISWELFSKTEKDRVSIEHILPQTPTKYYWQNMFRQYTAEEKKLLAGALGNLLPLSQSVNSSLQNDSFNDKKHSTDSGRRGYENGSHSEIEVSKNADWDADRIYSRTLHLLSFMELRWGFSFTEEQRSRLLYIQFVKDGRSIPDELDQKEILTNPNVEQKEQDDIRFQYWVVALEKIKKLLAADGHGPFSNAYPTASNSKDGYFGVSGIHLFCSVSHRPKKCKAGFWIDTGDFEGSRAIYSVLLSHRTEIESKLSFPTTWSDKENRRACSIIASVEGDYLNKDDWAALTSFQAKACDELARIAFYPYENEIRAVENQKSFV